MHFFALHNRFLLSATLPKAASLGVFTDDLRTLNIVVHNSCDVIQADVDTIMQQYDENTTQLLVEGGTVYALWLYAAS